MVTIIRAEYRRGEGAETSSEGGMMAMNFSELSCVAPHRHRCAREEPDGMAAKARSHWRGAYQ